jgi:hypothetical protein
VLEVEGVDGVARFRILCDRRGVAESESISFFVCYKVCFERLPHEAILLLTM